MSSFLDGCPRFLQPSVHAPEYDPFGSSIFVVDYSVFVGMSPKSIQTIFRHRHILVTGVKDEEPLEFDLDGLSTLGPLFNEIDVQGEIAHILPYIPFINII